MNLRCTGISLDENSRGGWTGWLEGVASFSDGHRLRFTGSTETGFRFKPSVRPGRPQFISFGSVPHRDAIYAYIADRDGREE